MIAIAKFLTGWIGWPYDCIEYDEDDDDDEDDYDDEEDIVPCGPSSDVRLVSGKYPKQCTSSSDCKLLHGDERDCDCGMDGKWWCIPHPADPDVLPFTGIYAKPREISGLKVGGA
jgi:hypothetical protein